MTVNAQNENNDAITVESRGINPAKESRKNARCGFTARCSMDVRLRRPIICAVEEKGERDHRDLSLSCVQRVSSRSGKPGIIR